MLENSPAGELSNYPQSGALHEQEVTMLMSAFVLALSLSNPLPARDLSAPAMPLMAVDEVSAVCPVCGKPIAPGTGIKVMVRGQEYTVDDKSCGEELTTNPDKYLNADGTPKNGKM
jgi:YHS domain-containing protein